MIIDTYKMDRVREVINCLKEEDLPELSNAHLITHLTDPIITYKYRTRIKPYSMIRTIGIHYGVVFEIELHLQKNISHIIIFHILGSDNSQEIHVYDRTAAGIKNTEWERQKLILEETQRTFFEPRQAAKYIRETIAEIINGYHLWDTTHTLERGEKEGKLLDIP